MQIDATSCNYITLFVRSFACFFFHLLTHHAELKKRCILSTPSSINKWVDCHIPISSILEHKDPLSCQATATEVSLHSLSITPLEQNLFICFDTLFCLSLYFCILKGLRRHDEWTIVVSHLYEICNISKEYFQLKKTRTIRLCTWCTKKSRWTIDDGCCKSMTNDDVNRYVTKSNVVV